jgi:hypothetical protein
MPQQHLDIGRCRAIVGCDAAEANFVPAMSLLSDVYAEQKAPVSGHRF